MPSASSKSNHDLSSTHTSPTHRPPALPNDLLLLSESQWLFTEAELLCTPSIRAGITPVKERESRGKGVNFILQVGIMLKLPQITLATASVYLHRFFMRHSMVDDRISMPGALKPGCHYYSVAATCLFLATKVEENCRKMRELVVSCVRVAQKNPGKVVDEQDKEYWRWRDTILQMEDMLLEAICFDLSLEPPYKTLFELLCYFGEENNKQLRNAAWAFVNDSCLTMLCLMFSSRTIAASALYAAARHCGVRFLDDEEGRPWWEVVGIELRCIRKALNYMAGVYENTPLRGGEGASIYERTPEEGDEWVAKTRERRGESDVYMRGMERRGSGASGLSEGSEGERRRGREEVMNEEIPWGKETREERERKKRRVDSETSGLKVTNGTAASAESSEDVKGVGSSKADDEHEEGEVEL